MKWQAGKKYKTRGGRVARVYATDGLANYPIHGAVLMADGWEDTTWKSDGRFDLGCLNPEWDLTEQEVA